MRVLVAYASKYGSTKGIADYIGEKLRGHGIQVNVQEVKEVNNLGDYDAFVIGSAVYMFHWMKEATKFVSKNREILSSHPVWLFSSGPVGNEAKDPKGRDYKVVSGPKELDELKDEVKPRDHKVFFGALDPTKLSGMIGFGYRMASRSEEARKAMPEGDFRDWKEIETWTHSIALNLQNLPAVTH